MGHQAEKADGVGETCGKMEIFTRVTGYMRPIASFNKGKQEEFKDRKVYSTESKPKDD